MVGNMSGNVGNVGGKGFGAKSCSREDSRQARHIITQKIYPFLGKDPALLIPVQHCPINATFDMFLDQSTWYVRLKSQHDPDWNVCSQQEQNKKPVPGKRDIFQCNYCGKQFRTEFYMDRHMDNKHGDRLNLLADGSSRCLGDLCGELGCGVYSDDGCGHDVLGSGGGRIGCKGCDKSEMGSRRIRCRALFHRCFNPLNDRARAKEVGRLREFFVGQFCDHLACDQNNRPLPRPTSGTGSRGGMDHSSSRVDGAEKTGIGRKGFVVFILVVLGVFYAVLVLGSRSSATRNDLRPSRRGKGRRGMMGGLSGAAKGWRGSGGRAVRGDDDRGRGEVVKGTSVGDGILRRRKL